MSEPAMNLPKPSPSGNNWSPERVEALRMRTEMSQTEFGKEVGVSRQTVGEWERGESAPSRLKQRALDRLAKRYQEDAAPAPVGNLVREQAPAPYASSAPTQNADYWRGVLYAAETMSETVTRLLREQREAADRLGAEVARRATQQSAATVPTPDHSSG